MGAIRALTITDWQNIRRDSLLQFVLVYPFILGVVLRFLIPFIIEAMAEQYDLAQYEGLMAGFFGLLIVPALIGIAFGFLLLDEKDERTLVALQVTPLSPQAYLQYRLTVPVLMSVISVVIVLPLMNIVEVSVSTLLPLAVLAGLEAPIFSLLLATLAKNKVQGLALMKGLSVTLIVPFVAWFVAEPWQWLMGVMPSFWPVKLFWMAQDGESVWLFYIAAVLFHGLILWGLVRRFAVVAYRD